MSEPSVIYDVKGLLKDLEALQPGLRKELVREVKKPAKPIVDNIKRHIPSVAPLSGMRTEGRLGWGSGKPANQVQIKFRSGRSRRSAITALVSIWITSPATAMVDVAGKGSLRKAKTLTGNYGYKGSYRKHAIRRGAKGMNGGQSFVRNLRSRNANDFIYPAVGDSIDDAQEQVKLIIDRYAKMVNRKLG